MAITTKDNFDYFSEVASKISGKVYFEEHANTEAVIISNIHFDALYQVRYRVDSKQVSNYANAMKNGAKFPPVRLALIEGKRSLTVIDGWHRLKAAVELGAQTVPAVVESMTHRDAMGHAALANLGHGLSVKKTELRRAFKLFIKSGKHRKGKGKGFMSYRELSTALYGCVAHTTLANWMRKDFPKIAYAMGVTEHGNANADVPRVDLQGGYWRQASEGLEQTLICFKEMTCPNARYMLHSEVQKLLAVMGEYSMEQPINEQEF